MIRATIDAAAHPAPASEAIRPAPALPMAHARVITRGALLLFGLPAAAIAAAPAPPVDPLADWRKVIVAAIRDCPQSRGDEIVVCAKDIGEAPPAYRYVRLTGRYEGIADDARRLPVRPAELPGATGVGSCSPVGAGGATGCEVRTADRWKQGQLRDRAAGGRP